MEFEKDSKDLSTKETFEITRDGETITVKRYNEEGVLIKKEAYTYYELEDNAETLYDEFGNLINESQVSKLEILSYENGVEKQKEEAHFSINGDIQLNIYYECNEKGEMIKRHSVEYDDFGETEKHFFYDDNGNITKQIIEDYDSYGNLERETFYNADNNITKRKIYKYDSEGNLWKEISYKYDEKGDRVEEDEIEYDDEDNIIGKSSEVMNNNDENYNVETYDNEYYENGKIKRKVGYGFDKESEQKIKIEYYYVYDENDSVMSMTKSHYAILEYDEDDEEYDDYSEEYILSKTEYDGSGNIIRIVDYEYDEDDFGDVILKSESEYNKDEKLVRKAVYDVNTGRFIGERFWDENGNLEKTSKMEYNTMFEKATKHEYDKDENIVGKTLYDMTINKPKSIIEYNTDGEIISQIYYEYDRNGNVFSKAVTSKETGKYTEFYDDGILKSKIDYELDEERNIIGKKEYEYSASGEVINIIEYDDNDNVLESQITNHTLEEIAEGINPDEKQIQEVVEESIESPTKHEQNKAIE